MARAVAHEFNNILSVIITCLELLELDNQPDAVRREVLTQAREAALLGAGLVQRLQAGSAPPQRGERPTTATVLASTGQRLRGALGEHIRLVTEIAPDLWPISADRAKLETCLRHLAANARAAMPTGGTLLLTADNISVREPAASPPECQPPTGDYVAIAVTDTGRGMGGTVMAQALAPCGGTRPPDRDGGLGVVFDFVRQSGGHVRAETMPGEGTTIELLLPRCQERASADGAATAR
ncbi:Histidine kinase [Rhodovastum atsumiense]|uniref:histidine kinase n=1 Tax=Rhodovastum atsumiense TaxID=504468 RepID=A0A5M6IT16_9PROT|nr:ATP-binding protein [Rhodovastum atsumiense]KAA5611402.1 hypothetical protein F1189_14800 [Rhodovastum atsumiense]CAH2603583.1 Histidine kinase [Rhodovastum atsumiense]